MSGSRRFMQNPRKSALKEFKILSLHRCRKTFFQFFLSLHWCRKTFFRFFSIASSVRKTFFQFVYRFIGPGKFFVGFFLSLHRCRKTFFGFFYRFIDAGKLFIGFFYRFIGEKNFAQQICFALFDFFSKIVFRYRFNRYISEYRCPSLPI